MAKYNTKDVKTKLQALHALDDGKKMSDVAKQFGVPLSTLSTWKKNRSSLEDSLSNITPDRKRKRTAKFEDVEDALLQWFIGARGQNAPISGPLMKKKAEQLAILMEFPDFQCSNGWLDRFKLRHGKVFRNVCGEGNSVSDENIFNWQNSLLPELLSEYKPEDIFNADEAGLFFELLPDKTMNFKGEACTGGKKGKQRVTIMVAANMTGSEKLPLLLIGRSANPRCFKNVKSLPVEYISNKKAWMTAAIFEEWLKKYDNKFAKQKRKVAFIVDNCTAHPHVQGLQVSYHTLYSIF